MAGDPFERLGVLDPAARDKALEVLDEISRPLERRELEKALGRFGVTRTERERIVPALLDLQLIALFKPRA